MYIAKTKTPDNNWGSNPLECYIDVNIAKEKKKPFLKLSKKKKKPNCINTNSCLRADVCLFFLLQRAGSDPNPYP